jgi:DNA-nicking Smr family endonuclease
MTASRDNENNSFMSRHFPDATRLRQHKQEAAKTGSKKHAVKRKTTGADNETLPLRLPGISGISGDSVLSYRRDGVQDRVFQQLKRGKLDCRSRLDLHGTTVEQAYAEVTRFLQGAQDAGLDCILIIHGQGYRSANGVPVLKQNLDYWLRNEYKVLAFHSATPADGGKGAVYVLLRKKKH